MARNVKLIFTIHITVIIRNKTYLLSFTCRRLSLQDARIHGFNVLYQQTKKLFVEAKHKLCRKEIRGEKSLRDIMAGFSHHHQCFPNAGKAAFFCISLSNLLHRQTTHTGNERKRELTLTIFMCQTNTTGCPILNSHELSWKQVVFLSLTSRGAEIQRGPKQRKPES